MVSYLLEVNATDLQVC